MRAYLDRDGWRSATGRGIQEQRADEIRSAVQAVPEAALLEAYFKAVLPPPHLPYPGQPNRYVGEAASDLWDQSELGFALGSIAGRSRATSMRASLKKCLAPAEYLTALEDLRTQTQAAIGDRLPHATYGLLPPPLALELEYIQAYAMELGPTAELQRRFDELVAAHPVDDVCHSMVLSSIKRATRLAQERHQKGAR